MIRIFQNDFYYWFSNIFRLGIQRVNNITVFRNGFTSFYQCDLFFRQNYLVRKKKLHCFPKKVVVAYLLFVKITIVKSVRIFTRIQTEYGEVLRIFPYSVRMRGNIDQNNSEYGHFSRSE